MQVDLGDRLSGIRNNNPTRNTRWIPADVWQKQGMTTQVLTLPGGTYLNLLIFIYLILIS